MTWQLLLFGLLPPVLFVIVDYKFGLKWGIVFAVGVAIALFAISYIQLGLFDPTLTAEVGLIIVMGFVSIKMKNSVYFKFQPVLIDLLLAGFIAYFQFFDRPVMIRYLPYMKPMMDESYRAMMENPEFLAKMARVSGHLIYALLVHAGLVAYTAVKCRNIVWLITRSFVIYLIIFVTMLISLNT